MFSTCSFQGKNAKKAEISSRRRNLSVIVDASNPSISLLVVNVCCLSLHNFIISACPFSWCPLSSFFAPGVQISVWLFFQWRRRDITTKIRRRREKHANKERETRGTNRITRWFRQQFFLTGFWLFFCWLPAEKKSATVFLSSFSCNSSTSFWSSVPDAFSCFFFLLSLIFPPLSLLEACEGKESPFGFLCSPAQRHCCCSHFKIFLPANRVSWRSHLLSFSRRYSHVDMILLMPWKLEGTPLPWILQESHLILLSLFSREKFSHHFSQRKNHMKNIIRGKEVREEAVARETTWRLLFYS